MKTLVELLEKSTKQFSDNILMWEKNNGKYSGITYKELHREVLRFGAGLYAMGIKKGDRIGLVAEGSTNWLVSELGILYAGAINVPLSVKLDAKTEIAFRLKHSGSKMVIVSYTQAEKVFEIFDEIEDLEKIIHLDSTNATEDYNLLFNDIKKQGDQILKNPEKNSAFESIWKNMKPDDLANISYTSGTTADPKGIMLSHNNFTENVKQANSLMEITPDFKTLTILPWDHSFAHTACLYSFMVNGASIAAQENGRTPLETLRNIPKNINEVKPDIMMSVPAISKAFRKNIEAGINKKGKTAKKLFKQGLSIAYKYNGNGFNKGKGTRALLKPLYAFYDKVIFSKIRENFGGNLKFFIGGGALLDIELQRFFAAIGIPVMQGYGLSEASPVISSNALHAYKFGSSGKLVKYLDIKICDDDGHELPLGQKGEIVIKGGNVMKGYWKNDMATNETIINGWLHTGDMGYLSNDGFLYVLGRFKSLLISNDGEKYSPEGIEEAIVDQSPYIDQCMLYNNQNAYTCGMVVPNITALKKLLVEQNTEPNTKKGKELIINTVENEINAYKKGGKYEGMFPERWLPTTFIILPESFNEDNHLLNSTMKMVRGKIVEYFNTELDFLYTPQAKNTHNDMNFNAVSKWLLKN